MILEDDMACLREAILKARRSAKKPSRPRSLESELSQRLCYSDKYDECYHDYELLPCALVEYESGEEVT